MIVYIGIEKGLGGEGGVNWYNVILIKNVFKNF